MNCVLNLTSLWYFYTSICEQRGLPPQCSHIVLSDIHLMISAAPSITFLPTPCSPLSPSAPELFFFLGRGGDLVLVLHL